MRDEQEQLIKKVRISTWVLVLLSISLYAGFILLALLTASGAAG